MTKDEIILEEYKNNEENEKTEQMLKRYLNKWAHVSALLNLNQLRVEDGRVILTECTFPTEAELVELLERRERGKKYATYLRDQNES